MVLGGKRVTSENFLKAGRKDESIVVEADVSDDNDNKGKDRTQYCL